MHTPFLRVDPDPPTRVPLVATSALHCAWRATSGPPFVTLKHTLASLNESRAVVRRKLGPFQVCYCSACTPHPLAPLAWVPPHCPRAHNGTTVRGPLCDPLRPMPSNPPHYCFYILAFTTTLSLLSPTHPGPPGRTPPSAPARWTPAPHTCGYRGRASNMTAASTCQHRAYQHQKNVLRCLKSRHVHYTSQRTGP